MRDHAQKKARRFFLSAAADQRLCSARRSSWAGFSLLELLVVLAVSVILTSLLLPALSQVKENAHRVICSSNLRQIGLAITIYAKDNSDRLPYSVLLRELDMPGELMAARLGDERAEWDGIGRLYAGGYCPAPGCYYCPSHTGSHTLDRYRYDWLKPGKQWIFTNYHYSGDVDWENTSRLRRLTEGEKLVLATDGFRTLEDFSHKTGMNALRGDGSVRWHEATHEFADQLPLAGGAEQSTYRHLWKFIENQGVIDN